jgi:hypothetical protein
MTNCIPSVYKKKSKIIFCFIKKGTEIKRIMALQYPC